MENKEAKFYHVFNQVFAKQLSAQEFAYKHYQNPYKVSRPVFHEEAADGEVAGVNAFLGANFLVHNAVHFAAQSCDSAVLPHHQGKGIFSRILRTAEEQLAAESLAFLYGFPNKNSYPGFKKLGWTHVGDFTRAFLPLKAEKLLAKKVGKLATIAKVFNPLLTSKLVRAAKRTGHLQVQEHASCPFTPEDFAIINQVPGIMTQRSREYYTWKVDNNPIRKFKYAVARKEETLQGFIIWELQGCSINILDWQCQDSTVLARLLYSLKDQGDVINISYVNPRSNELTLLASLGFKDAAQVAKVPPIPLVVKTLNPQLNLNHPQDWICRGLDLDVVLS